LLLFALLTRNPYFRADNFTVRANELIRIKQIYFSERTFGSNIALASMTFVLSERRGGLAKMLAKQLVCGASRGK
jgi:hypothetical protein